MSDQRITVVAGEGGMPVTVIEHAGTFTTIHCRYDAEGQPVLELTQPGGRRLAIVNPVTQVVRT